ncbi:DUF4344 domain-containing metallopeptidase [Mycobacterium sp. M26]|uniref:DUF4344 domain-containing metallopeptidase n=1 Tax=Mycobacterium sp. M26 TaxID=1762962 RepID=UPI00073F8104|nr:DUF4344 domain-containing metallopeptidase [Mycobacterium sp. M26]
MKHTLVVVVAATLTAGCGGTAPAPSTTTAEATSTATSKAAKPTATDDESGAMVVTYEDATTPEASKGRDLMERTHFLDDLAASVTESFRLPFDVPVVGTECGEANDYWNVEEKKLVMCYEDVDESIRVFTEAGDPNPDDTARRIGIASFFHELGHMAIDIYDLPVTGREEDVADQLSAYELLSPDDDGKVDEDYVQAARDIAREYTVLSDEGGELEKEAFADVHTLDQARAYNFECWIYGSDPKANADIVENGSLPEDRAEGCEEEWGQLTRGWGTLLEPHLR